MEAFLLRHSRRSMGERGMKFLGSRTRFAKSILIALCIAALPAIGPANASGITSPAGLKDTIDWAQIGAENNFFSTPLTVVSVDGVTVTATSSGGFFNRIDQFNPVDQMGSWFGNFTPGEALIENINASQITLTFATPVTAAGAPIEPNALGPFTAQITVNGTETFTEDGNATQTGDGSAIFIGWSGGPITTLQFELTAAANGNTTDFAIGTVSLASVPEPSTWAMMMLGFPGLCFVALRARERKGHISAI
jgi:PEP-CTERM motif